MIDWSQCPDVERHPEICSGAWCVKGTRVMVECILDNSPDCTAEQIARELYDLDVETVRRILRAADMEDAAMTDTPFLTMEAMQDMVDAQPWDAALDLPLPENPTLELLDAARNNFLSISIMRRACWRPTSLLRLGSSPQLNCVFSLP
jgi:uncharacterized protein (DUF433 family)